MLLLKLLVSFGQFLIIFSDSKLTNLIVFFLNLIFIAPQKIVESKGKFDCYLIFPSLFFNGNSLLIVINF
jgi:hypothetical protein